MNYLKIGLMACLFLVATGTISAQSCHKDKKDASCCSASKTTTKAETALASDAAFATKTFKVLGNCGMCKKTIEGAATKVDGVQVANWDQEAKAITVSFDPEVATLQKIKEGIAASGYDTEGVRATDEAYSALHGCCQYDRVKL